jgi:hypothetical protein
MSIHPKGMTVWSKEEKSRAGREVRPEPDSLQSKSWRQIFSAVTLLTGLALLLPGALFAGSVAVRQIEGVSHGFLVLKTVDGITIAGGDQAQVVHGNRVYSQEKFWFNDGSVYQETTVFSQEKQLRLIKDRVVQKGPSFKHPTDTLIDASTGEVTVHYEKDGKNKVLKKKVKLPPDLANGMVFEFLKNLPPGTNGITVPYLATTPEPQLVKLVITRDGEEPFSVGQANFKATRYVLKIDISGIKGSLAKLLGKQPSDRYAWILQGKASTFVRYQGAFETGGPTWSIERAGPSWPQKGASDSGKK